MATGRGRGRAFYNLIKTTVISSVTPPCILTMIHTYTVLEAVVLESAYTTT
jgi:hypothetical protein